jgi:hypothetical protein
MKFRRLASISVLIAAAILSSVNHALGQTKTITISVNDPRPLAAAILKIEELSGIPVNYEDVPIYFSGDLIDVTDQARTPVPPGGRRMMAAPMRTFSVAIAVDEATGKLLGLKAVEEALLQLIAAYNSSNLPGGFDLEVYSGVFFVKPIRYRDVTGDTKGMVSILSTLITLPEEKRNPYKTAQLVLSQLPIPAGYSAYPGTLISHVGQVLVGAQNEPARHVIARMLATDQSATALHPNASLDAGWSYKFLLDSDAKFYFLNISRVPNSPRRILPEVKTPGPPPRSPRPRRSSREQQRDRQQ